MCQRALIAIGLAGHPRLLIADEPTSALDVTVQRQVLDHLAAMAADLGTAVLFITHDLALAAERAGGSSSCGTAGSCEVGAAEQIIADPQDEYTRRLVACAPALSASERRPPLAEPAAIWWFTDLTKVFPAARTAAVSTASSSPPSTRCPSGCGGGSTLAVAGESGSGKSTLARMVLGLTNRRPERWPSTASTFAALDRPGTLQFRRRAQPVFQNPYSSLIRCTRCSALIEEPLESTASATGSRRRSVADLLDEVALPSAILARRPRELSGGQRQRVAIAGPGAAAGPAGVRQAVSALDVIVQGPDPAACWPNCRTGSGCPTCSSATTWR